jgi:nicotinic acid phosphoribosyltransferase
VTPLSTLCTDAYKFSMAQAGFPLRRETFYLSFRRGGVQHVPIDLEAAVRAMIDGLHATREEAAFLREYGYGITDAMETALADASSVEIAAVPKGAWVLEREPILTITGPSFLVSWLEPSLLWLNYPIQLATALRSLGGGPPPVELVTATCEEHERILRAALVEAGGPQPRVVREDAEYAARVQKQVRALVDIVGDPNRLFEVGLRSAVCLEQHRIVLEACRSAGVMRTSDVHHARLLGMTPIGTMGHEHVQRWGADLPAFQAMRDMRTAPPTYLLDTFDTMGSGIAAAVAAMKERPHRCAIRYDSGNKFIQYLHACELLHDQGLAPTHVLEDAMDATMTQHFERLREFTQWPVEAQVYGYGGFIVAAPMSNPLTRDRVSAVFKLSETGGAPRMKFGNEAAGGKESVPGRPVVWRRVRGKGPLGIVAQAGEPVVDDYVVLSGNPEALEQLRLCNVLDLQRVQATAPAERVISLSAATTALVARLREQPLEP